jgi:hypothetical protein
MINLNRIIDRCQQWLHWPQPSFLQRHLLGLKTDSFDIDFTARRLAAETSAEYLSTNMRQAQKFELDYDIYQAVKDWVTVEGHYLEFGVATGRTIRHWAQHWPHAEVHGFDSFEGLPETWHYAMRKGHFAQPLPQVPDNVKLHVGWFNDTLPSWLMENKGSIAFLHVDSDLYSSAKYILDNLRRRLVPGTVILFNEYFNFPGWQQDEFRAWQEFTQRYKIQYEYLGFVTSHQEVAVRITKIG